ncbi:MFS transporter [Allosphingosinicella deserti]|uniref:MFS transporter n=1 Tax=Allosphingosinicella deserti TaxID=2116704 RepID=A0A2P7QKQ1_9SPHN|nr:MFS transporter [Sphingomonas deserti]PSJ38557.1 MFS transporter [Sphingomonas deserti]
MSAESARAFRASPALVHFALAMGGFAIGTTEFATMSLLPFFSRGLGIDEPTAGHVISAYALGVVVGAPLLAVLSARMARRTLLLLLMAIFAVANGLSALAPSYQAMLVFRFLSGLPHGAYFGIAALVAASLVPQERRTQAVARVMLGLTTATLVGVPFANWIGQAFGWRWGFGIVAVVAAATVAALWLVAPHDRPEPGASPLKELGALRRGQVWLTLATGAIGFGGMFAVYTYLGSTLMDVTGVSAAAAPIVFVIFGLGTTVGTLVVPRFADRWLMPTAGALLIWSAISLALYTVSAGNIWTISAAVFAIGVGGALGTVLQTRLMDVAEEAQSLAAALNHSAFNFANALGPWLGGLAIAAGYGWTSTGWVGAALALGGLLFWALSLQHARTRARSQGELATAH